MPLLESFIVRVRQALGLVFEAILPQLRERYNNQVAGGETQICEYPYGPSSYGNGTNRLKDDISVLGHFLPRLLLIKAFQDRSNSSNPLLSKLINELNQTIEEFPEIEERINQLEAAVLITQHIAIIFGQTVSPNQETSQYQEPSEDTTQPPCSISTLHGEYMAMHQVYVALNYVLQDTLKLH